MFVEHSIFGYRHAKVRTGGSTYAEERVRRSDHLLQDRLTDTREGLDSSLLYNLIPCLLRP